MTDVEVKYTFVVEVEDPDDPAEIEAVMDEYFANTGSVGPPDSWAVV